MSRAVGVVDEHGRLAQRHLGSRHRIGALAGRESVALGDEQRTRRRRRTAVGQHELIGAIGTEHALVAQHVLDVDATRAVGAHDPLVVVDEYNARLHGATLAHGRMPVVGQVAWREQVLIAQVATRHRHQSPMIATDFLAHVVGVRLEVFGEDAARELAVL